MLLRLYQLSLQLIGKYFFHGESEAAVFQTTEQEEKSRIAHDKTAVSSTKAMIPLHDAEIMGAHLTALIPSLKSACKHVEPEFLQLGTRLQKVYTDATDLTELTVAAVEACGASSSEAQLERIVSVARRTLSAQEQSHKRVEQGLCLLQQITGHLEKLDSMSITIRNIAKSLKMVGLNVSIESSRNDEAREMFTQLAEDIKTLSDTVFKVSASICGDAEYARQRLRSVGEEVVQTREKLITLATHAEKTIDGTAPQVERIMRLSMNVLNKAGQQTEQISRQVGDVVVGIQIHDSISQRIVHIAESLEEIITLINDLNSAKETAETNTSHLGGVHTVLNLQIAQLRRLIEEISSVRENTLRAFTTIQSVVNDVLENMKTAGSSEIRSSGTEATGADRGNRSPLHSLKSALKDLRGLIGSGQEGLNQIKEAIAQSAETVDRLSSHMVTVRDINFDIHLKALNAIVKSMKLGRSGRSIEVLVHEIKELAERSDAFVTDVQRLTGHIHTDTEALKNQILSHQESEEKSDDLHTFIQSFAGACAAFDHHAEGIAQRGTVLKETLARVVIQLRFMVSFEEELSRHLKELKDLKHMALPYAESAQERDILDTGKIAERYTMDKERRIHFRIFGSQTDQGAHDLRNGSLPSYDEAERTPVPFTPSALRRSEEIGSDASADGARDDLIDDEESFGDNVELF